MRNKILVAALIIVGLASVAYAAFAQTLTISGTTTASGDWDVQITGITRTGSTGSATDAATTPSFTGTTATFDVDFAYPGSSATYDITIQNLGNITAKVTAIPSVTTINAAEPVDVKYTIVSGPAVNDTLAPAGSTTVTVKAEWLSTATTNPVSASKTATLAYDYAQN
ncbi:hypothetical protein KA093_03400 [Candidatus Saccharibacteria bacterium]|nr:hypothetical protein [Candidatus Saccharibacteria bacterium]